MSRMKSTFLGVALLVGMASAPAFAQSGPAGTWEVVVESPQGAQNLTLELKVAGDKADGTLTSMVGTMPVTGTVKPEGLELSGTLEVQGMSLPIVVTAKTVADTIDGSMKFGDFGEFPFKGKRAVGAPPAPPTASSSAAPAAPATGIVGKWNVTLTLQGMGEFPLSATFAQEGETVTGTLTSMMGEVPVKGTFVGSALKLEFTTETPQGPLTVNMTGDLTSQGLTGKASIAGLGEADWKAVRGQ